MKPAKRYKVPVFVYLFTCVLERVFYGHSTPTFAILPSTFFEERVSVKTFTELLTDRSHEYCWRRSISCWRNHTFKALILLVRLSSSIFISCSLIPDSLHRHSISASAFDLECSRMIGHTPAFMRTNPLLSSLKVSLCADNSIKRCASLCGFIVREPFKAFGILHHPVKPVVEAVERLGSFRGVSP